MDKTKSKKAQSRASRKSCSFSSIGFGVWHKLDGEIAEAKIRMVFQALVRSKPSAKEVLKERDGRWQSKAPFLRSPKCPVLFKLLPVICFVIAALYITETIHLV